jgi:hypothetical protein
VKSEEWLSEQGREEEEGVEEGSSECELEKTLKPDDPPPSCRGSIMSYLYMCVCG